MASFQAEIGRDRPKKRENFFFRSEPFLPGPSLKFPTKLAKKNQKIKNHYLGFILGRHGSGQDERKIKKFSRLDPFLPDLS